MFHDSQNACGFAADIFINLLLFWPCHNLTTLYFPSYQERGREQLTKTTLLSLRISTSFLSFTCCTQKHKEHVKMLWTQHFKFSNGIVFCTCRFQKFS